MNLDKDKIIKALLTLAALFLGVFGLTRLIGGNSLTLTEYADQNPELQFIAETEETLSSESSLEEPEVTTEPLAPEALQSENFDPEQPVASTLTGAALNAGIPEDLRTSYTESFYYEPLSDNLKRYITGISFPEDATAITYDELRYVHILHYDFNGELSEGELICNQAIAQDLVEIFHELYLNEYQLEKVLLIDEYDGDDTASMEDNNTSCFNYRTVEGSTSLSKHALGLAIDINPLYNPYITYNEDNTENVSPASALPYADRSIAFPYKIDESDLCYKLFTEKGFTWGGNWNSSKDYQHFQTVIPK